MNRFQQTVIYFVARSSFQKVRLFIVAIAFSQLVILANGAIAQSDDDGLLPHIDEYGAGDPIYSEVQRIADLFAARLGVTLGRPVVVFGDFSALPSAPHGGQSLALMRPVRPVPDPARTGHRNWERQARDAGLHTCGIYLSVGVTAVSQLELKHALAHEVFHCFQIKITGLDRLYELPQWLVEGTASFAGEDYTQFGSPLIGGRWNRYLSPHFPSIVDIQCGEKAILL